MRPSSRVPWALRPSLPSEQLPSWVPRPLRQGLRWWTSWRASQSWYHSSWSALRLLLHIRYFRNAHQLGWRNSRISFSIAKASNDSYRTTVLASMREGLSIDCFISKSLLRGTVSVDASGFAETNSIGLRGNIYITENKFCAERCIARPPNGMVRYFCTFPARRHANAWPYGKHGAGLGKLRPLEVLVRGVGL